MGGNHGLVPPPLAGRRRKGPTMNVQRLRPATPQSVFDRVAPYYDLLNSCLSLGLDRRWRRQAADCLCLPAKALVLDIATGTGSLARAVAARACAGRIVACDLNARMLSIAASRLRRSRLPIDLLRCRAEQLPFPSNFFDAVVMAFALDDLRERRTAAAEILRVLKPGGKLAILELSVPDNAILHACYRLYLCAFPLFDLFSRSGGYRHLAEEIRTYRGRAAVEQLLREAGFAEYSCMNLTGGITRIHRAEKRQAGTAAANQDHGQVMLAETGSGPAC
jgi:demethylmenaquinone methyltransferase/2-methoxy-6-polyprenyl-1,4-benzoquinol methylase